MNNLIDMFNNLPPSEAKKLGTKDSFVNELMECKSKEEEIAVLKKRGIPLEHFGKAYKE